MPRTKAIKKKPVTKPCEFACNLINHIETNVKEITVKLDRMQNEYLAKVKSDLKMAKLQIPKQLLDKTLAELRELPLNWSGNTTNASVLQISKSVTEKKRHPLTRSSSFDDEGYLTAESSNGTSGSRQTRGRSRTVQKSSRTSRSCSSRGKLISSAVPDKYKTPGQKIPPVSYGTITPKVKPNTPQVLLRRPKQGEVALSLQGSPLFTGTVVSDNVANINIPLEDGRLLSIQPQRGLRISQIPQLDLETKRQLETLRDNLNKVCAVTTNGR